MCGGSWGPTGTRISEALHLGMTLGKKKTQVRKRREREREREKRGFFFFLACNSHMFFEKVQHLQPIIQQSEKKCNRLGKDRTRASTYLLWASTVACPDGSPVAKRTAVFLPRSPQQVGPHDTLLVLIERFHYLHNWIPAFGVRLRWQPLAKGINVRPVASPLFFPTLARRAATFLLDHRFSADEFPVGFQNITGTTIE